MFHPFNFAVKFRFGHVNKNYYFLLLFWRSCVNLNFGCAKGR